MAGEAGNAGAGTGEGNGGAAAGSAAASGQAQAGAGNSTNTNSSGMANSATPGSQAAPAAAAGSTPPADWQSSFDENTRGYIANKGWKDPTNMLDSYRNLEKLVGSSPDSVIRLPKADDPQAADAMNRIYDQLGRPKTPDAYKLEIPKENGSPEFAKMAGEQFHKLGLSEKQGQDLVKWWNEQQGTTLKSMTDQRAQANNDAKTSLKNEWGAAHEQNIGLAKRAAKEFGVPAAVVDALDAHMGYDGVMKFFHNIGSKLGSEPGTFHTGGTVAGSGAMTPAQARARINELKTDKGWISRYMAGDAKAREEKNALDRFAVGEAAS